MLALSFLGPFDVRLDDRPVVAFETDKVRALLAYLAVEAGQEHRRSHLAGLLWPDFTETSARTTLRHVLYKLRQTIGDVAAVPPYLTITRQTLGFNTTAAYTLDTQRFTELLQRAHAHHHPELGRCPDCLAALQQAVELYKGDFLTDLAIQESATFEEWRLVQQERFHVDVMDALHELTSAYAVSGDYDVSLIYARRQIALEPWREEAHRQAMRALVHLDQRSAAVAQYHACRQLLANELDIEPEAATTALYDAIRNRTFPAALTDATLHEKQVGAQSGQFRTEGPAAPAKPPLSLPVELTPFVGRESELAEIVAQLRKPNVRLLTLVGPGGIGKTRLAVEAASTMAGTPSHYPDGIYFVGLAALGDAAALASTIATTLALTPSSDDIEQRLLSFLHGRRLLLILDNLEHLLDGIPLILRILATAPGVQLLTTTRQQLNVQGERVYRLRGMDYPEQATLSHAAASAAVRLFVQSAQSVASDFRLTEDHLPAVLHICRLVDGMPLGLAMASVWAEMLTPAEIAEEIEKSADFLSIAWQNVPDRHRSMRAVFAWSWRLLADEEKLAFRRLCVFRGGFTHEAAATVTGASLQVLNNLLHRSLLQPVIADGDTPSRFQIHELLHQFASEQMGPDERSAVEVRHSRYYLSLVATRERSLLRSDPNKAAFELQADIDNIRQAWACAVDRLDLDLLSRSAWALRTYYDTTGSLVECTLAFRAVAERIQGLLEAGATSNPLRLSDLGILGKMGAVYANLLVVQAQYEEAILWAQQAIRMANTSGNDETEALGHLSWGQALYRQGHFAEAESHMGRTLRLVSCMKPQSVESELLHDIEGLALLWSAALALQTGAPEKATMQFRQGLTLSQRLGKKRMQAACLINLANQARDAGDLATARQDYEHALRLTDHGYPGGEGLAYLELGDVLRLQGDYSQARDNFKTALAIAEAIQSFNVAANAVSWLARLHAYLGDYSQASAWLARYLQRKSDFEDREAEMHYLHAQAVLALQRNLPAQALANATRASRLSQVALTIEHANSLVLIGHAQTQLQNFAKATTAYQETMAIVTALDRSYAAAEAQAGLAEIAGKQGEWFRAKSLVEEILESLAGNQRIGFDEPFYTYLICHRVLDATQDARSDSLLTTAYSRLETYAERIDDCGQRQSFWEKVPVHRALLQVYTEVYGLKDPSDRQYGATEPSDISRG